MSDPIGGPAQPASLSADSPQAGPALRVYRADAPADRPVAGGPALPIAIISDAQVAAGYPVAGNRPIPIAVVSDARPTIGQRPQPVYVVNAAPPAPTITPTGDQGVSNPTAISGDGLGPAIRMGAWVPERALAAGYSITNGAAWATPNADRQTVQGPYLMPYSGSLVVGVFGRSGTNAQQVRLIAFQMFATGGVRAPTSETDPATSGNRPTTAIAASAALTIPAPAAVTGTASTNRITWTGHGRSVGDPLLFTALTGGSGLSTTTRYYVRQVVDANTITLTTTPGGAEVDFTTNLTAATITVNGWIGAFTINVAADDQIGVGVWAENVASGASFYRYTGSDNVRLRRYRSNNLIRPWSAAGPLTDFPASGSTTDATAEEFAVRLELTPTALAAPAGLALAPQPDRSILVTWDAVAGAERYRVERSPAGAGTWSVAGVVAGTSLRDPDLADGQAYDYRVVSIWWNAPSAASATATATAGGVRVAYAAASPTPLPATEIVANVWNGRQGGTGIPEADGGANAIIYSRNYEIGELDGRVTFDASGPFDFSAILAARDAATAAGKLYAYRTRYTVPSQSRPTGDNLPPYMRAGGNYTTTNSGNVWWPAHSVAAVQAGILSEIDAEGAALNGLAGIGYRDGSRLRQYGEDNGEAGGDPPTPAFVDTVNARVIATLPDEVLVFACTPYLEEAVRWRELQAGCHLRYDGSGDEDYPAVPGRWFMGTSPRCRTAYQIGRQRLHVAELRQQLSNDATGDLRVALFADEVAYLPGGLHLLSDQNTATYSTLSAGRKAAVLAILPQLGARITVLHVDTPSPIARGNVGRYLLRWRNIGNGPELDARAPVLQLRSGATVVWQSDPLALSLADLLPRAGPTDAVDLLTIPASVAPGTYSLAVAIPAAGLGRPAYQLAIDGQTADGAYVLTSVTVE